MKVGLERKVIAWSVVTTLAILLVHALAVLLRKSFVPEAPPAAYLLVWATVGTMLGSLITQRWPFAAKGSYVIFTGLGLAGTALLTIVDNNLFVPALSVPVVCGLAGMAGRAIASRLTNRLDGSLTRFPVRSILWALLALLMVTQTARLSSWVTDPTEEWWISTSDPFYSQHMCMTAYIYAADLNRQGVDNIYDHSLYPGLNPNAKIHTTIQNFSPDDPYQYPPQFLLLPRIAIALSDDFDIIKIFWLFLQALFFGFIAWTVARFIGGEVGLTAALLIPVIWISFPMLANLQYGQFHMMSILLGVAAMMWFSKEKHLLGGAALALAMLSKMAPGILLIYLIAKRRWKEVGWTLGLCVAFSLLALAVIGTKPFLAFFTYQLPKLQNGQAFAFADVWPEYRDLLIAINQSPFAMIYKLDALGLPGMTLGVAKITHVIYTALVLVIAVLAARIKGNDHHQLLIWLALVNLAGFVSKGAWGDYIPIGTIWMMTFMIKEFTATSARKIVMAFMWLFMFLSLGVLPLPGLGDPSVFISLALVGMIMIISFNVWVIWNQNRMQTK